MDFLKLKISKSIQNLRERRFSNKQDSSSIYSSIQENNDNESIANNKLAEISILKELMKKKNI